MGAFLKIVDARHSDMQLEKLNFVMQFKYQKTEMVISNI
jgi:hypothetical protein